MPPPAVNSLSFLCDNRRHLVCVPYSIENLHAMAAALNLKRCWFHKDHYDIPKRRIVEITAMCTVVTPRQIAGVARRKKQRP